MKIIINKNCLKYSNNNKQKNKERILRKVPEPGVKWLCYKEIIIIYFQFTILPHLKK